MRVSDRVAGLMALRGSVRLCWRERERERREEREKRKRRERRERGERGERGERENERERERSVGLGESCPMLWCGCV